ncbi:MAG TPA: amidohydrolase family protein, partial [Gemmatimonadales bacterium]|nr:amidohydrolase family protein [Gemmatimonadales bacterium]
MVHLLPLVVPICGILGLEPCPTTPAPPYAITGVSVLPMDRERVLEGYTVIVRNGAIETLGPADQVSVPQDAVRIDGTGKYLIPGLTEMHTHLSPGAGDAGDGLGRQLRLALANGVTTLRGLVAPPGIIPIRDKVNSGAILGPTLYVAGPSLNGKSVPDPETGRRLVDDAKRQGYDLLKTHGGLTAESYDAIVAEAKKTGLRLVGHVTQGYGLDRALAAGQQVEHLDGYIAAALPPGVTAPDDQIIPDDISAKVTPEAIRAIAEKTRKAGVWNGMTLAIFQVFASGKSPTELAMAPEMKYVPPQALSSWSDQMKEAPGSLPIYLAVRDSIAVALYRAGARLLVSGDAPQIFLVAGFGTHREMQAMVHAGIPNYAVLEAATKNAAEWLGRADAGTIAPGK